METIEFEIYKGKSFSSLCKEIVVNQNEKKDQIDILISELRPLIKSVNDAMVIVPLIRDYLDTGIKNDEQLVKLAAVIQRILSKQNEGGDGDQSFAITDEERKQLLDAMQDVQKNSTELVKVKEIKS